MTMRRWPRWGIVPALLALFCQIIGGAVMAVDADAATDPAGFTTIICHSATGPSGPGAPEHHHNSDDCALCPVCQALAQTSNFVTPEAPRLLLPRLADPVALPAVQPVTPKTRAVRAAQPRGPPSI
jgi:hypothetical protein